MTTRRVVRDLVLLAVLSATAMSSQTTSPVPQPREFRSTPETLQSQWPNSPLRASAAMVVSDNKIASDAGVEVLREGGNAVDAAVAVALALAVVEPAAGNIGGGGFMLIRLASGRTGFVDYREIAPAGASRDMYLKSDGNLDAESSRNGYRSVAVPGTVAGLALALKSFGTMRFAQVVAPAIRLAEDGFSIDEALAASLREASPVLGRFPTSRRIFLKNGTFLLQGDVLQQPELAQTLRRIATNGPSDFYRGRTAHDLADEMRRSGGLITLEDLAHYAAKIRKPLVKNYKVNGVDWEVITSPPPSSGGVAAIEALNILGPVELRSWDDPESVHWVIEAMRRAFADRALYLADPDFAKVPVAQLTADCYAAGLRKTIDLIRPSSSGQVGVDDPAILKKQAFSRCGQNAGAILVNDNPNAIELALAETTRAGHTTHFSVVDANGNAVANTYTINDSFGSGVTCSDGFLLNDEMDDFTGHPGVPNMFGLIQSTANGILPGKRPLSSMMPTILLRDGHLSFVTGSPGGPRIISATLLSILNWMRLGSDAQVAINAPRFHQQWFPEEVLLEPIFPSSVADDLARRGYRVAPQRSWIGEVQAIGIDPVSGERLGAPDPRHNGSASGY